MWRDACVLWLTCGKVRGQSLFFLSIMWIPRTEFRSSALAISTFTQEPCQWHKKYIFSAVLLDISQMGSF